MFDKLAATLLGTALGDALGLPAERLSPRAIARQFGRVDRFRLLGRTGFVSDDTEQSALVAQSLARYPTDPTRCADAFRRSMLGWLMRLPWGVGLGTLRSGFKMAAGIRPSGVMSAGNGSSMRAAIIGVFFADDPASRLAFGRSLAEVTHREPRGVEGALFVAEFAAGLSLGVEPLDAVNLARSVVEVPLLANALDLAIRLAKSGVSHAEAVKQLGNSGYVVHTVPLATFYLLRAGESVLESLSDAIAEGGDTDSICAILGAWLGARSGLAGLPANLIDRIHDGPFGPTHLRKLATALATIREGGSASKVGYSATAALARNLALYPVILGHGFRRMVPL